MTYRWREHVGPNEDFQLGYRTREEADEWVRNDPMTRLGDALDAGVRQRIDAEVEMEIRDAFQLAERSPWPPSEELYADLYGDIR